MSRPNRASQLENEGKIDHTRQRDLYDPTSSELRATVVGGGGIGSATAVLLSKLGVPYLTLVDYDTVEEHNIPNQLYPINMVGKKKVQVLKTLCEMFGSSEVTAIDAKIQDATRALHGTVVTALDNMETRSFVWEQVKNSVRVDWLIDARIGGQEIVIWTINPRDPEDIEQYEEFALFTDEEGEEAPCTARAVIDVMGFVASMIVRNVRLSEKGFKPQRLQSLSVQELVMNTWGEDLRTINSQSTSATSTLSKEALLAKSWR